MGSVKYPHAETLELKLILALVRPPTLANQDIARARSCALLPALCLSPLDHTQLVAGAITRVIARQIPAHLTHVCPAVEEPLLSPWLARALARASAVVVSVTRPPTNAALPVSKAEVQVLMTLDAIALQIVIVSPILVIPLALTSVFHHVVLHPTWQQIALALPPVNAPLDSVTYPTITVGLLASKLKP